MDKKGSPKRRTHLLPPIPKKKNELSTLLNSKIHI
jgi:hypothetical protein